MFRENPAIRFMYLHWRAPFEPDSLVRLIDAFVGSLDLSETEFTQAEGETGRPMYDPKSILKLYM